MSRPDVDDKNKLFVGGLSWQTTNESLKDYFDKFGEIMDSKVMINRQTNRSRGFGFVTYKDADSVNKVLMQSVHELDGKRIDPKGCNQQAANLNRKIKESPKVFVGGVPGQVGKDELTTFFQQYGMVLDVNLMLGKDRDPNRHRGFGFVTFESQDTVDRLRALRFVEIQGRQVEIKKAEPQTPKNQGQQGQWPGQEGQWGGQQQWGQGGTGQGGENAGGWGGGAEGQWGGAQGQWGGWDQQQWAGYQQYGYGYDPNWQQGQGQWGAQGDASQQNYQQGANGYGYGPYGQYPQGAPAQGGPPGGGAAAAAAGGYGGYDPSQQQAPPQGGPPPAGPPPTAGYGQPPQQGGAGGPPPPVQGDDKTGGYGANDGQGYNRHQAYHPYRR